MNQQIIVIYLILSYELSKQLNNFTILITKYDKMIILRKRVRRQKISSLADYG